MREMTGVLGVVAVFGGLLLVTVAAAFVALSSWAGWNRRSTVIVCGVGVAVCTALAGALVLLLGAVAP